MEVDWSFYLYRILHLWKKKRQCYTNRLHYECCVTLYVNSKWPKSGRVKQMIRPLIHVIAISFKDTATTWPKMLHHWLTSIIWIKHKSRWINFPVISNATKSFKKHVKCTKYLKCYQTDNIQKLNTISMHVHIS